VKVYADGQPYDILPDEVEVRAQAKQGFAVAEEGPYVAALVTELTSKLVEEGQAREFVRRVQDLRKSASLEVADRVNLYIQASHALKAAIETHREYIMTETLAVSLGFQDLPAGAPSAQDEFDGEKFSVALLKA
jgi:isoleucyl-tRNA synthetase